tara:strand:+ start:13 stop:459 length:447 start_codon:yes stop_codon:yes gene_type:complete
MAALDKLIDLLEQVKQTDPSFTDKASRALDALVGTSDPAHPVPATAPEPEPEPEISYPDRVELTKTHLKEIQDEQKALTQKITELGLLQQNYESDKEALLEYVEQKQKYLREFIVNLKKTYNLDPEAVYLLNFPEKEGEKATFVKKQG